MERTRPTAVPPRKDETFDRPDFGKSADNNRRCATCACHIAIPDPNRIGASQSLCRLNPVTPVFVPSQIAGKAPVMNLTYMPTDPTFVCFAGWQPIDTPPGYKAELMANIAGAIP